MFANSLTRKVSLMVGPVILEVLVKHYFDRLKKDAEGEGSGTSLKDDDVLYHEAFTIVKSFLKASTYHTIEELQAFSNTRTPSPPWTHVVRTLVPMSCCEEAAPYLIKALGGEEVARRLVGGIKWWQVRGVNGVDAQWITARKDWQDAKKRHKKQQEQKQNGVKHASVDDAHDGAESVYEKNMDAMRCILYLHGGGYYFGSVDQERYSIQRFARKINGRVFAINYRLAPQYPFPCALHDALAAYLYLIRPPEDSAHLAVDPAHIVVAGDSAGGGLSLALLQVIRDSGLPAPAGAFLISPWCDLTHSFKSVHTNTNTQDVIPESGLSFHKPSLLWPPPSEEVASRVQASLRFRIRQAFNKPEEPIHNAQEATVMPNAVTTPISPTPPVDPEKVVVRVSSGETVEVTEQLQFYTRNSLLDHPLVSPAMSYLGGLPPLLFIAGDKEVLRDEIIYTAHKAAYPERYPITNQARELYPPLRGIEEHCKPTSVHLQVYDEAPHILPILFSFTEPAKFCFRAIASFCKLVTQMTPIPVPEAPSPPTPTSTSPRRQTLFASFKQHTTRHPPSPRPASPASPILEDAQQVAEPEPAIEDVPAEKPTPRRTISNRISRSSSKLFRRQSSYTPSSPPHSPGIPPATPIVKSKTIQPTMAPPKEASVSSGDTDVGGPRFQASPPTSAEPPGERMAGEISVYSDIKDVFNWECRMIRERVATTGVIRPLEPEDQLDATTLPPERVGKISETTIRRYMKERGIFDLKFASTLKSIEKTRRHNLQRAKEDTIKRLGVLRQSLHRDGKAAANGQKKKKEVKEDVLSSPDWGWAWALDEAEDPPPSSIVARRDTEEARKLAEVADQAVLSEDQTFSGNNLWSVVISFLTATPGKQTHTLHAHSEPESDNKHPNVSSEAISDKGSSSATASRGAKSEKRRSRLPHLHLFKRHAAEQSS
ncbi:hypothetical protein CVT26_004401 [Gymnopilus dilepis]|uniref:Alpha/beta hydrolase fold-3 domain-containing protein n=1 Tax=Gymnopilus dilepis TaxID=231916 RepID=A0A409WNB3_9AGAR|nr:hypothetical protein CVT26_004401 [Gymnopilus dilepis]